MRIQHLIRAVLLISLLSVASIDSAEARISFSGSSHSSTSSFKSGFSSHKTSAASPSTPQSSAKNTSFGSFGAPAGSAQANSAVTGSTSALSKNLGATTANSTALKTLDARNQAATPAPAAATSTMVGSGMQSGYANPPIYTQGIVPHTIIVQRDSGFSSSPFLWFMLGRSMNNQSGDRVVYEHPAYPIYPATSTIGNPDGVNPGPVATTWEPQESFGAKLLRIVLWLMLAIALVMGVSYLLGKRAARTVSNKSHYSLGKN